MQRRGEKNRRKPRKMRLGKEEEKEEEERKHWVRYRSRLKSWDKRGACGKELGRCMGVELDMTC